jgi:hypothetical protein
VKRNESLLAMPTLIVTATATCNESLPQKEIGSRSLGVVRRWGSHPDCDCLSGFGSDSGCDHALCPPWHLGVGSCEDQALRSLPRWIASECGAE